MFSRIKDFLKYLYQYPNVKKSLGVVLIIIGFIALITPFTPGSWLIFVGLGYFGVRILFWERVLLWLKNRHSNKL